MRVGKKGGTTIMHQSDVDRFDILIFETAKTRMKRKEKERKELKIKAEKHKREIEERGVCDGCEEHDEYLRWVRDGEFYSCYECFLHDLNCEADSMVPWRRVEQMGEYLEDYEWRDCWKSEY